MCFGALCSSLPACYLVQSQGDFKRNGCPNCEEFLDVSTLFVTIGCISDVSSQMKGNTDRIEETTTLYFDGAIAIIKPEESWVVR